jgi:hypothetical protein
VEILVGPTSRPGILVPPERAGYDGAMATDALVDVSYRGFVLGKRLRLLQVGPRSAYVACDAPMPVGTELILAVDETMTIPAQVARVREADSKDGPTGMWLWTGAAETQAQTWWDAHVSAPDPHIPEPAGGRIRTEGPLATQAEARPEVEATRVETAAETRLPAGYQEGDTVEEPPEAREAATPAAGTAARALAESESVTATEAPASDAPDSAPDSADHSTPDSADDNAVAASAASDTGSDPGEAQREAAGGTDVRDDGGYAVEIGGDNTGDDTGNDTGNDTGEEVSEPGATGSGRARRARGTEVMTAVELAEVLGTTPEAAAEAAAGASEDGGAEDDEPSGRPREVRRTQVMTAVEVDELLQADSADEPAKPEATAKGKSRNKRRRRR